MASYLTQALRRRGWSLSPVSPFTGQRRWEGNLPIATNKYVEEWNARRERLEEEFRFSPKNLLILGITCIGVPVMLFKLTILQYDGADATNGRARRRFWPRDSPNDS